MERNTKIKSIKDNFEKKALEYDNLTKKIIPYYEEMLNALLIAVPFDKDEQIDVLDLGSGTGMVASKVKRLFPNARITCVDISPNMLDLAKARLSPHNGIDYYITDFYEMDFTKKYHLIVSSLALHHLLNDGDKKMFYQKIYRSLADGGVFYNADVVLGSSDFIQEKYISKWIEFMEKQNTADEIMKVHLPRYYEEDTPASLIKHLSMLDDIGFKDIDVIWKYYNFAVYGGGK